MIKIIIGFKDKKKNLPNYYESKFFNLWKMKYFSKEQGIGKSSSSWFLICRNEKKKRTLKSGFA